MGKLDDHRHVEIQPGEDGMSENLEVHVTMDLLTGALLPGSPIEPEKSSVGFEVNR
jgi:hypothetical protein